MEKLDRNWLTKDNTDFEYKKYILLAYLQSIKKKFEIYELYPYLGELIEHFRSLKQLLTNKDKLTKREISSLDLEKLEIVYTTIEDNIFKEIEELVRYALNEMANTIRLGRKKFDEVETKIKFDHVGILPTYFKDGFIILTVKGNSSIYTYKINDLIVDKMPYKMVITRPLEALLDNNFLITPEEIKRDYITSLCDYVPATFNTTTKIDLSIDHTLLPITKRKILQYIKSNK